MKRICLLAFIVLTFLQLPAQSWKGTGLTSVNYLLISSTESHNDDLYATVFNGFTANLFKLKPGGTGWDTVHTDGIAVPRFLKSTGNHLYMSSVNSGVFSFLYYSVDGGTHFTIDTVGLPKSFSGVSLIYGLQSYNGKVIVNMGAAGYYLKDTAEVQWRSINITAGTAPLTCLNDTLFAYTNGTNALRISGDYGTTWQVRTTNLPANFGMSKIEADHISDRLYAAGAESNNVNYGLYYSDDHGATWTRQDLSAFIFKNANNTQQLITAIYASGPTLYISLENNKDQSAPDIISSSTGVNGFTYDTLGLPLQGSGQLYALSILKHKDKIVLGFDLVDVFMNDSNGTIPTAVRENNMQAVEFTLYPNPAGDRLSVSVAENILFDQVHIMDVSGKVLITSRGRDIDLSSLSKGIYFVAVFSGNQLLATKKLVKE